MSTHDVPILIIGGGIVGLSTSLLLSHHNIPSLTVERHASTSIHPRARSVNARTMEVFRHLDLDTLVREAGASLSASKGIYAGSSLREVVEGKKRAEGERTMPFKGLAGGIGPASGAWVTQDCAEPVLARAAGERKGKVNFFTECVGVEQNSEGVMATLKDRETGKVEKVRAHYLIAADGAKSPIRAQLDVPTSGRGEMGYLLNILFEADLKELVHRREFSLLKVEREEVRGLFTSINNSDRWVFHLSYDPAKGEKAEDFSKERCKELLRIAIGIPDLEIEIKSVLPWEPSVRIAERLQTGRIFLAGDAAHQMPPWAGQGANSGIADAYNLVWKLAAVMKGHADKKLLGTYDVERIPVGREAAEASAGGADGSGLIPTGLSWIVVKSWARKIPLISGHGYGYTSQAICEEDTSPLGGWSWRPWTIPSLFLSIDGRPGRRAPHLWVERGGSRISTLDLFSKTFVLLAGSDGTSWLDAAKEVSSSLGIEIAAYRIGPEGDLNAPKGEFEAAAGIYPQGAILVRPDDFVAWRERRRSSNPQAILEKAMRQALCLQ